jgi:hypothetical protein
MAEELVGTLAILGTNIVTNLINTLVTTLIARNRWAADEAALEQAREQLSRVKAERENLARELEEAKKRLGKLEKRRQIFTYRQPVLLIGPRAVGKTSLMHHWHVPWDASEASATYLHQTCDVPVYDHHTDPPANGHPGSQAPSTFHLVLRVHDFPGELRAQQMVAKLARDETVRLREGSKCNLGAVLICMFDAEEAHIGIRPETQQYYNGDLFRTLREMHPELQAAGGIWLPRRRYGRKPAGRINVRSRH